MLAAVILVICISALNASPDTLPKHIMPCGLEIPPIGLGSYDDLKKNEQQKINMWLNGIEAGYRLLDTAYEYENQKHLGLAIKQIMADKKIERKNFFITTKVWNTFHTKDRVVSNIRYELKDLGLEYTDLALLHFPVSVKPSLKDHVMPRTYYTKFDNGSIVPLCWEKDLCYLQAWRGLEAAHSLGLARHIGVANFNQHQLEKIFSIANIKPVVLQVECHPLYNNEKLTNWARTMNMTVICYSPMRKSTPELLDNPVLQELADKYGKTVRQVALRWNMQRGNIVIPRSYDKYHQKENLDAVNFVIEDDDMNKINEIPQGNKVIYPGRLLPEGMKDHPDNPFVNDK